MPPTIVGSRHHLCANILDGHLQQANGKFEGIETGEYESNGNAMKQAAHTSVRGCTLAPSMLERTVWSLFSFVTAREAACRALSSTGVDDDTPPSMVGLEITGLARTRKAAATRRNTFAFILANKPLLHSLFTR
jgi:hypothetical protein